MEAGVGIEDGVLGQPNGCRSAAEDASDERPRPKGQVNAGGGISFSKELISFSLYGKIPRKSSKSVARTITGHSKAKNQLIGWLNDRPCDSAISYLTTISHIYIIHSLQRGLGTNP